MNFSKSQLIAYKSYLKGDNILISGAGGTGKTTLIKSINEHAKEHDKAIQICAMTGCASLLLQCGATTIHSWSGLGTRLNESTEKTAKKCLLKYGVRKRWQMIDILVIDEISMLSKKAFEVLDLTGRRARNNNSYFGGIQIIFSGDFYQLPPIGETGVIDTFLFCFESSIWNSVFKKQIELTTIFRQSDIRFRKILNQVRKGGISKISYEILMECANKDSSSLDIKPVKLYPRKKMVDEINNNELDKLAGETNVYTSKVITKENETISRRDIDFFQNQLSCCETLCLKIGTQVMSIINYDLESEFPICNGSCGVVSHFLDNKNPIVKFNNGLLKEICPYTWVSFDDKIKITQIPLILAWCISIHKAQGATLEMAEINIGPGIFENGQSYVALSRVKDLDGLYIKSLDPWGITASPKVKTFYETIKSQKKYKPERTLPDNALTKWLKL